MIKKKDPSVLNISHNAKKIIGKIDNENFLGLGLTSTSRPKLFLFAASLGLEVDTPTPLKKKESLVRWDYLIGEESLLYSAFINKLEDKDNLEECTEKSKIYELIEQYANTGFDLIEDMMNTKSEQINMLKMIEELDNKYNEIFGQTN